MHQKKMTLFIMMFYLIVPMHTQAQEAPLEPSQFINVQGVPIAIYESEGTEGPGILVIHGNTSSANSFARFMRSPFAIQNRVVALDLPGYGRSGNRLMGYNVGNFREAILQVALTTEVDNGVIVGWSWGGDLALQASTVLPNAKGFFIFGTAPIGGAPSGAPQPLLNATESYAGLAVHYGIIPILLPVQIRDYVNAFFRPNYSPVPTILYDDGYRTAGGTRAAVAVFGLGLDFTSQQEVPIAQNLQVPLAMIHAEQDAFVNLEYLRFIEGSIPHLWTGETVVVPGYGHALQWESPEVFTDLLEDFINDLE